MSGCDEGCLAAPAPMVGDRQEHRVDSKDLAEFGEGALGFEWV